MARLIGFIVIILAIIVAFMYFFGKGEDQAKAEAVVGETKEVFSAIGDFLKRQKDKYDAGEFDRMIGKVERTVGRLKTSAPEDKQSVEITLRELQIELRKIDTLQLSETDKVKLRKVLNDLEAQLK